MYIDDLDCDWRKHPFLRQRFHVKDEQIIQKIASAGLRHVFIDTARGKDVDIAPIEPSAAIQQPAVAPHECSTLRGNESTNAIPTSEQLSGARALYRETTSVVRNLMEGTRSGRQVEVSAVNPAAERIVQSVFNNRHAITSVARIKTKDEYTFMHCVSVAALMVAFARDLDLPETEIQEVAIGGLIHDIGKTLVSQEVLNKPARLNEDEYRHMRDHVTFSREILQDHPDVSQSALDVALMHHEQLDGAGYPLKLRGKEISQIGRMAAIVDIYDAVTSVRVYKEAWHPTKAMQLLMEQTPNKLDRDLVHRFARCIGIYPVGCAVALESGLVGIVLGQHENLLRPTLRVVYNRKQMQFVKVHDIDLGREKDLRITEAIDPTAYGIDIGDFV